MTQRILIGKLAVLLASLNEEEMDFLHPNLTEIRYCKGRVGSMNLQR